MHIPYISTSIEPGERLAISNTSTDENAIGKKKKKKTELSEKGEKMRYKCGI